MKVVKYNSKVVKVDLIVYCLKYQLEVSLLRIIGGAPELSCY